MSIGTASRQISEVDVTRDLIEGTTAFIRDYLKAHGIDFEGRPLPVSFVPTLIKEHDLHSAVGTIRAIRQILNRVIDEFILQHSAGQTDGPLHEFFRPYEKWWQLIASERRSLPHINLMRYDAIFDRHGRWSLLETNTACPGGTIHCARIRSAWLASPFGRAITASLDIIDQPIDSPDCFVRHLVKLACAVAGQRSPNIALCTYRGLYPNELDSLKAEFDRKKASGAIAGGTLVVCDIRELSFSDGIASYRDQPIHLIHNKLDPLAIEPSDPELRPWVQAASSERTQFLNGLGAFYLTEAKRIFALLSDPLWRVELGIDEDLERSIGVVPFTKLIEEWQQAKASGRNLHRLLLSQKDQFVLKADALTRGVGVTVGSNVDGFTWAKAIAETRKNNGVAQKRVDTPHR
jgi:hypothetical protein